MALGITPRRGGDKSVMPQESRREQQSWNERVRGETEVERLDRNWGSLLQELRVVQTGVQLLTGFLLTLPFQNRFTELPNYGKGVYLATVLFSISATVLLIAPVGMHRLLFQRHQLNALVSAAHKYALGGLVFLGLALTGVVVLIVGTVVGTMAGALVGACAAAEFVFFWLIYPLSCRRC